MLTLEILNANAATAALTDEQKSAIVTLSQNDESAVIGQKTGEIYGGLDKDILEASGIAKNGTEKTYEYAKRVIGEIKGQAAEVGTLRTQITDLTKEKERLEGVIAKGGGDAEVKKQLETARTDLANVQAQYNTLKSDYDKIKTESEARLLDYRIGNEFTQASAGLKFKAGIPQSAADVLLQQAIAKVKEMGPQFVSDGKGGEVLTFTENGVIRRNPENGLNPYTAKELLVKELTTMGILDTGRQQTGAGTQGGIVTPGAGAGIDLSGVRTQDEAYEAITKSLLAQGLTLASKEFDAKMQQAWKDNNVAALPKK